MKASSAWNGLVAVVLALDLWLLLGDPGTKCPACQKRRGLRHVCDWQEA